MSTNLRNEARRRYEAVKKREYRADPNKGAKIRERDRVRRKNQEWKAKRNDRQRQKYARDPIVRKRVRAASDRYASKKRFRGMRGLSADAYMSMVELQCGRCLICGRTPQKLVIDHSHITGKIRGLLCETCNVGLGMFKDNQVNLTNAINYLERK